MASKKPLPTTFVERHRNYILDIFLEGRLGREAQSAEGCLQSITPLSDGEKFELVARYRDIEIGRGIYRKHGPPGRIETAETVEARGALIGIIEDALAKRKEAHQAELRKDRASRLVPLPCISCEHALGYDIQDQLFAVSGGEEVSTCPSCGEPLNLEHFRQHYTQRIAQLRADLQNAEKALRQVVGLKSRRF